MKYGCRQRAVIHALGLTIFSEPVVSVQPGKTVIFLRQASGDLADVAATQFQSVIAKMGMGWKTVTLDRATSDELRGARFVVAFQPILNGPDHVEIWPNDPNKLDAEVNDLVARLFTGKAREDKPDRVPAPVPVAPSKPAKAHTLRIGRETKGRRGKGVTIISDLPATLSEADREELATKLKSRCGTGGTYKDSVIEIQGDQRDRLTTELEKMGYKVKRVGG